MEHEQNNILVLPVSVVGKVDIGRLTREVEIIDEFLNQQSLREPGTPTKLPKTTRLLDEIVATNQLNVLVEADRKRLLSFLLNVQAKAPVIHASFSADPSPLFIQNMMMWMRRELHPIVLLQIGLQPNMGAGCVVRTTNKYFDLSLRRHFKSKRPLLMEKLRGTSIAEPAAVTAAAPVQEATA